MSVLLDLSVYQEETADIRMMDGQLLHLKKPSQKMVIDMLQLGTLSPELNGTEIQRALNLVLLEILNNNADGLTFGEETAEALTLDMKLAIVSAYSEFATKLQSNPTTSSRGGRTKKTAAARRS